MKTLFCAAVSVACGLTLLTSATAAPHVSATFPDLPKSYVFTPAGRFTRLHAGVTYQASEFPIALRVTPTSGSWVGAQWKSGTDYFSGGPPPNYGWVHLAHRGYTPADPPRGLVTIMTAYTKTPSVAQTVNVLKTRGRGATYGETTPVQVAGFSGIQFDGRLTGARNADRIGHYFVPFSPPRHSAGYYPDEYGVYGGVFHVDVLSVRGKTVVIYIDSVALLDDQFAGFLNGADQLLKSLRFPLS
jgi:hypothetical protein